METRDRMPSAVDQQPQVNPWIVAVAVMFATFMEVLDTTVVNVSLPHIAGSLSVSVTKPPGRSPPTLWPTPSSCP